MGLDTSHNCFHGAYSAFMRFRRAIAKAAGIPLPLMDGFYRFPEWAIENLTPGAKSEINQIISYLPLSWDIFKGEPLIPLLHHSDFDGVIKSADCAGIAKRLREIADLVDTAEGGGHLGNIRDAVIRFAEGCELASSLGEDVEFH